MGRILCSKSNTSMAVSRAAIYSVNYDATDHQQIPSGLSVGLCGPGPLGDPLGQCTGLSMGIAQLYPNDTTGVPVFMCLPVHVVG